MIILNMSVSYGHFHTVIGIISMSTEKGFPRP